MSQLQPREFLEFGIPGIQEFLFHCTFCVSGHHDYTLAFRRVTTGVYVLSCRLTSGPLWLGIFPFLFVVCFGSFWVICVALEI